MAGQSEIEWTDATWNPVTGCLMVSPGCTNSYAMRMAARLQSMGHPAYQNITRRSGGRPVWTGQVNLVDSAIDVPLRWRTPRRIFVNSMSDLFQEGVPADFIRKIWNVMASANWHIYQILTKRPENMLRVIEQEGLPVLDNVWLGTSVESGDYRSRIDYLKDVPAAIRFISFEPLIGPVNELSLEGIDWAIVGGESGPSCRPIVADWVSDILDACKVADCDAFFFKQWGGSNKKKTGRMFLGRTWDEYPGKYC